jgi:hypothetical protein
VTVADHCARIAIKVADIASSQSVDPLLEAGEQPQHSHQRGLAAARRSGHRRELATVNAQTHIAQRVGIQSIQAVAFGDALQIDYGDVAHGEIQRRDGIRNETSIQRGFASDWRVSRNSCRI